LERKRIKFAIASISSLILISMTASAILADIQAYFVGANQSLVQMVLTIPSLMAVVFAFASGPLSMRLPKKNIVIFGLICGLIGGITAFAFGTTSISVLLFCSVLIGVAQGINSTISMALIADYFTGDESSTLMGLQSAFLNGGSMVLIFISSMLASFKWNYAYLVYLMFLPVIFITMKNLPKDHPTTKIENNNTRNYGKLNLTVYFMALLMFLLGTFMFVFQTNIALLVVSKGFGDASTTGLINTTMSAVGMITGVLFGRIQKKLKHLMISIALLIASFAMFLIFAVGSLPIIYFAAICMGFSLGSIIPAGTFIAANAVTRGMSANAIAVVTAAINFGMFVSPIIINVLSNSFGGGSIPFKFLVSAIGLLGVALLAFAGHNHMIKKEMQN